MIKGTKAASSVTIARSYPNANDQPKKEKLRTWHDMASLYVILII
jgi:hypothetical protein